MRVPHLELRRRDRVDSGDRRGYREVGRAHGGQCRG